jgi:hypothetical protein
MGVPAGDFGVDDWQHSRMAVMRGVENGFAMVRPAHDGLVIASDAFGRLQEGCARGPDHGRRRSPARPRPEALLPYRQHLPVGMRSRGVRTRRTFDAARNTKHGPLFLLASSSARLTLALIGLLAENRP